jgi:hypothetical protein
MVLMSFDKKLIKDRKNYEKNRLFLHLGKTSHKNQRS